MNDKSRGTHEKITAIYISFTCHVKEQANDEGWDAHDGNEVVVPHALKAGSAYIQKMRPCFSEDAWSTLGFVCIFESIKGALLWTLFALSRTFTAL